MVSAANDEEVIESHSGDSYPSMMRGSSSALTLQAEVEEEALYTCWGISIIARKHKGLTQLKMDDALNPRCGKWLLSLAFPVDSSPLIFEKKISTPNPCSFLTAKGIYNFLQKKKKNVCVEARYSFIQLTTYPSLDTPSLDLLHSQDHWTIHCTAPAKY